MSEQFETAPLSRDPFVANVLWVGVCLLCHAPLSSDEDFRGNAGSGEAYWEDGLGDDLIVLWDEQGVVALVHDHHERLAPLIPPPPPALRGLTERALSSAVRATGWLWICGDSSSPRLPTRSRPARNNSLLSLIDAFSGPSLIGATARYGTSPRRRLIPARNPMGCSLRIRSKPLLSPPQCPPSALS